MRATPTEGERKQSPKKRKRKAVPPSPQEPGIAENTARIPDQMYGNPVTRGCVKNVCAGCLGHNKELKDFPILMCDGGCGREFHLECCLPPLTSAEIPEGSYLCIDCDKDGTSSLLERYFDNVWEERAKYDTSRHHVESLFDQDERIPVSEIPKVTNIHREALRGVRNMQGTSVPNELGPDFLIGRPLRLYCPVGNSYHDGRIIDWRRTTHSRPMSLSFASDMNDFMFGDISEIARCEFLVAFPAGLNYRKRTVHQWLILEEHSLAVGTSLIWAYDTRRKDWTPGLIWLRSSLELMPVVSKMSEAEGQVLYDVNNIGKTRAWALSQVFGRETHLLLLVDEEALDLFSPSFPERLSRAVETADGPRVDCSCMLAYTEVDEQRQIRHWRRLALKNTNHDMALNIADKYMLPPLIMNQEAGSREIVESGPRSCPLIRLGLDRLWIMKQLKSQGFEQTKDNAADITVQPVRSRSEAIRKLQERAKVEPDGV